MYVLSFRDMTQQARGAVTAPVVYRVDGVDKDYAWAPFQPLGLQPADPVAFAQDVQGAHVCFLVHGFNVDRDSGFEAGGAMAQEFTGEGPLSQMAPPDQLALVTPGVDFFIPVLWPGDWLHWLPLNYPFVLGTARVVGRYFGQFLTSSKTTLRRASFFTHSFGARVALETLQYAVAPQGGVGQGRAPPTFDCAVLTAAAATDTVLDSPFYAAGLAALRRVVVVSAPTDEILSKWFPLGNPVEQALWSNDPGPDIALGRDGPVLAADSPIRQKIEWYVVTDAAPGIQQLHGDYMPDPAHPFAPLPNGWTQKRERISRLTQAVFDGSIAPWPARSAIPVA